ncbi:hypothetical protein [Pedobacter nototheniae]|uniref:hypothetical protein n=1 Tax=Pedobacter nototheniae TaxID=2488994 RepID=UPI001038B13F|nr:hypothetical protein [Pedobacter nototheniae]
MGWSSWNNFRVNINESNKGYTMQDLWKTKDFGPLNVKTQTFEVPKHGVVVLKIIGEAITFNVFQSSK